MQYIKICKNLSHDSPRKRVYFDISHLLIFIYIIERCEIPKFKGVCSVDVFSAVKKRFSFAVFIFYWPIKNAFVTESDCPNSVNKWTCAFLPMTNCTTPDVVTQCKDQQCLSQQIKGQMWTVITNNSTSSGQFLSDADAEAAACGKFPFEHNKQMGITSRVDPPHFALALPHDDTVWRIDFPDTFWGLYTYLFMARPNAFYRPKMKKLIHEMRVRSTPHFHANTPCIAVHIRRGDRIRAGIDMLQFCANVTYDKNETNTVKRGCVNINNPDEFGECPKEVNQDLGCKTVPFEAVRLKHVIAKIPRLVNPPIHDLLVFSDDAIFIHEQAQELAKTSPEWKIHTLKTPDLPPNVDMVEYHKNFRVYEKAVGHTRRFAGTESGVLFQTSLRSVQQCSAFIAHFGSGVASLFYHSMCVEHAGRYGICPPAYDFRWGL